MEYAPKRDNLATLFRIIEGYTVRHQLVAPRRVLDDARLSHQPLAPLLTRAIAAMRRAGPAEVVELVA